MRLLYRRHGETPTTFYLYELALSLPIIIQPLRFLTRLLTCIVVRRRYGLVVDSLG